MDSRRKSIAPIIASVLVLFPVYSYAAGSAPVTVVNKSPIPVSVSSPISINTTSALPVTGNVSVTGTVAVSQQLFLREFSVFDTQKLDSYLVPAGQRVVIQYVNITSSSEGDCVIDLNTPLPGGGTELGPRFRFNVRSAVNSSWKQLSAQVLIPVPAGKRIDVQCTGDDANILTTGYISNE